MRKLEVLKVGMVHIKKKKKKSVLWVGKFMLIFLLVIFPLTFQILTPFPLQFKDNF